MTATEQSDYLVDLDTFRGPLDLLLYLVKRDEVDLRDIPIGAWPSSSSNILTYSI